MSAPETYRNWKLRVEDILGCIAKIKLLTKGLDFESYQADAKTADAIIRNFEIMGEATNHKLGPGHGGYNHRTPGHTTVTGILGGEGRFTHGDLR